VRRGALGATLVAALIPAAQPLFAQGDPSPRPRSFEVSAALIALGGVDFGMHSATLTSDNPGNSDFSLFSAATTIGTGAGFDGRVTFNVTRTFGVEGGFTWSRQTVRSRITGDFEGAPATTISERLSTYFIEGAVVAHLRRLCFGGGKGQPFVFGGGGYLRQLDGGAFLVDTGTVGHVGGGVKYFFASRPQGLRRSLGLRADGRLYVRSGGLELDVEKTRRVSWGASTGVTLRF
jgi:hypothetical protein